MIFHGVVRKAGRSWGVVSLFLLMAYSISSPCIGQPRQWYVAVDAGIPKLLSDMSSEAWGHVNGRFALQYYPGYRLTKEQVEKNTQPLAGLLGFRVMAEAVGSYYRTTYETQTLADEYGIDEQSRTTIYSILFDVSISPWARSITADQVEEANGTITPLFGVGAGYSWYSPHSVGARKYYEGPYLTSPCVYSYFGLLLRASQHICITGEAKAAYYFSDSLDGVSRSGSRNDALLTCSVGLMFRIGSK